MQNKYFDTKDCFISTHRNGTPDIKMTVVHQPSGLSVSKEGRSTNNLQESLFTELKRKWEDKYIPKAVSSIWRMHQEDPTTPDWQRA